MLKYVLYPMFGITVLAGYTISAMAGVDLTSEAVQRHGLPLGYGPGQYQYAPPTVWRTGFHGPSLYRAETSGSSSGSGGFYGGYSGGK